MKRSADLARKLEQLFWVFLFVNPFLDIINGLYINLVQGVGVLDVKTTSTLGVTPSLLVRMLMLLVFAGYVLLVRDRRAILTALPMGLAWVMSMVAEYATLGSAKLFLDTQYTARFCYNIVILLVYSRVFAHRWGSDGRALLGKLQHMAAFTLTVLSLSILISAVAGVGYSTYADRVGYRGSRGFFYAGNDITAVLALLLPLNVAAQMQLDKNAPLSLRVWWGLAGAFGGNALMIIGSKTAFIAVAFTYGVMLAAAIVAAIRGNRQAMWGFVWAAAFALGICGVLMLLSGGALWDSIVSSYAVTEHLAQTEGVETAIFSGRQDKLVFHLQEYQAGGPLVWLFGLGRGSQAEILEMDVFEVIFYYGIFGALAFLWLYAKVAIDLFRTILRRPDVMSTAIFIALGMCAGYLFIAGHILFSVTSGFYFAFVILYSRVYLARDSQEVLLWKTRA